MTDLIFVEQKPMEGREQTLAPGATIGREGCDVNLMDPEVSRRHAAIRDQGGSLAIEDLGSTNGTFVNDRRLTAVHVLQAGDVVRLGNTVWAIRSNSGAGATTVGQVQTGGPQVTAARSVPTDIQVPSAPPAPQPTTAQQVPAAAVAAAPQQPAQPAAPSSRSVGPRGDVEQPPEVAPSAIRRVLPPPAPGQAPAFQNPGSRPGGSAATLVSATIVCLIIVAATAAALIVYFATY